MKLRELELVELVDPGGTPIGVATVRDAHTAPGQLHRAFSVMLVDPAGRVLLQQRAAGKTRFPLRWANACCGHPQPGQAVIEAARERLDQELGVPGMALVGVGVYTYRAADPATGRVEHEYDHVVLGRVPAELTLEPNAAEVAATRWADPAALAGVASGPEYAPWLAGVLALAMGVHSAE